MPYQRLAARLVDAPSPTVSTLPDGSVDRYCRLSAGAFDPIDRRTTFAREAEAGGRKGFGLDPVRAEPGGQSVNTADQTHALGADTTCYGHLDSSVFETLPFDTISMGEEVVAVDNPTVEDHRQTGGGDRFAGGLAVGLGAGWDWDVALACGNACASHYVATGETATADELRAWIA